MQAALALKPLAGEAQGDGGAGGGADFAEGQAGGGPGFGGGGVGGKHGPPDVVHPDEVHHPALDHGDGFPVQPDLFADQGAGGPVLFGDPVAVDLVRWVLHTLQLALRQRLLSVRSPRLNRWLAKVLNKVFPQLGQICCVTAGRTMTSNPGVGFPSATAETASRSQPPQPQAPAS